MAARRPGTREKEDYTGEYTYGHNLLNREIIEKLAGFATHWAVILHFENEAEPKHGLFPSIGLVNLFEQNKLCRASLLAGFRTSRQPQRPVPACFFRSLDYLLQYIDAGNNYRAITDKEDMKGFPPAGWCRPPVVAAPEDAAEATEAALEGSSKEMLERVPQTDPIRLFYSCRSWCVVTSFRMTMSSLRAQIGQDPAEMYHKFCNGELSTYTPVLGLLDSAPPTNLWLPQCVMLPLGALLYVHGHGRPYLPISLAELREVRLGGLHAVGDRKAARPLPLAPGVLPPLDVPVGFEPEVTEARRAGPSGPSGADGAAASSSRQAGGRVAQSAASGSGGGGGSAAGGSSSRADRNGAAAAGGGGAGGGLAAAASSSSLGGSRNGGGLSHDGSSARLDPHAPAKSEPDPILDSANWIMPQPFDTPIPPPPYTDDATTATAAAGAPGVSAAAAGGNGSAPAAEADPTVTMAAAAGVAHLPPSPFLGDSLNYGVQPTFETPPLRLFFGDQGQLGLAANWWFIDSTTNQIRGPHSPEQMMLSFVAGCCELHEETPVCGTDPDVRPPMVPPKAAFQPLGTLFQGVNEGSSYALVTRGDIISPLAQHFLGNRLRQPKPAAAAVPAAATTMTTTPVVLAVQQSQQQLQVQLPDAQRAQQASSQPQPQSVATVASSVAPAAAVAPAAPAAAQPQLVLQALQPQPQPQSQSQAQAAQPAQTQASPKPGQPVIQAPPAFTPGLPPGMQPSLRPVIQTHPVFRAPMPMMSHPFVRPAAMPVGTAAAAASAPKPAFVMPGASMMYLQHYGHAAPYTVAAHPLMAVTGASVPPPQPPPPPPR